MANNSEEKSPISPDSEFIRDFRAVPVTCKSEDDSIKIIGAILRITLSTLKVCGEKNNRLRASNSEVNSPILPKIELVRDFMNVFVTCKFDKNPLKMKSLSSGQHFPHYKSMGAIGKALKGK